MKNSVRAIVFMSALFVSSAAHALDIDEAKSTLISSGTSKGFEVEIRAEESGELFAKVTARAAKEEQLPSQLQIDLVCYSAIIRAELKRIGKSDIELKSFMRWRFMPLFKSETLMFSNFEETVKSVVYNLAGVGQATSLADFDIDTKQVFIVEKPSVFTTMRCVVGTPKIVGTTGVKVDVPAFSRSNASLYPNLR